MSTLPIRSLRSPRQLALLVLALAAVLGTTGAPASAAPASGEVVLTLKRGAKSSLLREGVKVGPGSGKGRTRTVKLAVAELELGGASVVKTGATLALSGGGESAKLRDVTLKIGAASTAISAKLGGKSRVFFRARGAASVDGLSVRVSGPLALTGNGAKALRGALGLDGISGGRLGSAAVLASMSAATPVPTPLVPDPPKQPEKEAYPYASECPVPAVEGNPGFGEAPGQVAGIAPSPSFGAGTGQEVTGTEIDWGFKDSFRSYVAFVPPAGSLQALDGAVAHPNGSMALAGSYWGFPTSGGTYEAGAAPDHSDDKLVVDGTGTVLFCKPGHGFNIALKNPAVTIDGASSRITATVGANMNGTWYPYQRADIAELDLSAIEPEVADSGNTLEWKDVPATLSADGELALGAIYDEGEALDKVTVKTTLNRPLLSQCAIAAGSTAPEPTVGFGLAALPTLSDPVTGSGGTINWGFRRAFRSTIQTNGSFALLGGAGASYPGNMGGAAGTPPTGGDGKFFRFPIAGYRYDDGGAGGADDRLIATSEATVGFCNPTHGYAAMISKPTLVIDGTDSRLTANVYSFQTGKGWIGGRVDLVDLNSTGVDAVAVAGDVSWGQVLPDETQMTAGIPTDGGFLTEALKLASMSLGGSAGSFDPVAAQIELPAP